jgi:hypothetical protein
VSDDDDSDAGWLTSLGTIKLGHKLNIPVRRRPTRSRLVAAQFCPFKPRAAVYEPECDLPLSNVGNEAADGVATQAHRN